jgi:cystathionine beta-lyase/cystathionine gamma-synthase
MFVPESVRHEAGVVPGFVRMSIGIEDVDDLWADMFQALDKASEPLKAKA